jgi:hypothetical protein
VPRALSDRIRETLVPEDTALLAAEWPKRFDYSMMQLDRARSGVRFVVTGKMDFSSVEIDISPGQV